MSRTSCAIMLLFIFLLPITGQAGKDEQIKVTSDQQGEELVQKWIETHKEGDSFVALDCVEGECTSYVKMTCYFGIIITTVADSKNTSNIKTVYKEKCPVENHYREWVETEDVTKFSKKDYANNGKCISGDCKNGMGHFLYQNICKYMGEWKNSKQTGRGIMILPDEGRYTGEFVNGRYEGIGTYTNPDGEDYTGEWKDTSFHGFGIHIESSGEKYTGRFVKNKRHGKGTCEFTNGDIYDGEWKENKFDGSGIMNYNDGTRYEGLWEKGEQNGNGTLYNQDGTVNKKGRWKNGIYQGEK